MSNNNDDNIKTTKMLCENIKSISGMPVYLSENFIKLIVNSILHNIMVENCESTDGKEKIIKTYIPYIGELNITMCGNNIANTEIKLNNWFKKFAVNAVNDFESPLMNSVSDIMVERIKEKYTAFLNGDLYE